MSAFLPSKELLGGIARLRNTPEERLLREFLRGKREAYLKALSVAQLTDVAQLQGRVQELDAMITLLETGK